MNVPRFDDLKSLHDHLWTYAIAGIERRANAMATPAFATTGLEGPAVRTVVARRIERTQRTIDFHTDRRSQKIAHLQTTPRVCWMAWDKDRSQQFQYFGEATIHVDDDVADSLWEDQTIDNLEFYFKTPAPGDAISEPGSAIDIDHLDEDDARQNFCVIRTVIDEMIWVHLHPEGEYRARFQWQDDRFKGQWIVP